MKGGLARRAAAALEAFFLLIPLFSFAGQTTYSTAYTPYPLESSDHSPRGEALGSAFTAVEGDSACLFYNPAGLAGIPDPQVSVVHQSWIAGLSQENLSGSLPLGKGEVLALGADYLGYGTLQSYDANGFSTGTYQPSRVTLVLGWGCRFFRNLSVGFSTRWLDQSLAPGAHDNASALGAGFLWNAFPRLNLGGFYTFLYSDAEVDLGQLKWGASYSLPIFRNSPALLSADFSMPPQGVYQVQCGMEQLLFGILTVRLGNQWELKDNQIGGFRGFTMGLGFRWEDMALDAAFAPDGDLGSSQIIGLTWRFPPASPRKIPAQAPPSPPAVNFSPPSQISANDKVVQVEMQFNLPGAGPKNRAAPKAAASQLEKDILALAQRVQANPKDAAAWRALGVLYWRAGQPGFTVQCYQEALQLRPDDLALREWLEQYRRLHPAPSKAGE